MKGKIAIAILFMLAIFHFSVAQNNELKFTLVKGANGKPLDKITAITQDRNGYMWFCGQGEKCIYRYDGIRWMKFRQENSNPNSLGGGNLETVYADSAGMIWIGFNGSGLDQYNPATGIFSHYRNRINDPGSLSNGTVNVILKDHRGILWVGTNNGLDRLDEKTGKFIHFRNEPGNQKSLSNNIVRAIYEDHSGVLWIGTGNSFDLQHPDDGGLNRMEPNGTFIRYFHDPKNPSSLINNKVRAIFEDSHGTFWIGTSGDGLHTMDRERGIFERHPYNPARPDQLSRPALRPQNIFDHITFINEDGTGNIWIGTYSEGISSYNPLTKKITHYLSGNGFPDSTTWSAFKSRDGVLWISTEISYLLFRVDPPKTINSITSVSGGVGSILEDNEGLIWVGTGESGLLKYDQQNRLIQQFKPDSSNAFSLFNNSVHALFQNQEDSIWLGTDDGVGIFNKHTRLFSRFSMGFTFKDRNSSSIYAIFQDRLGSKWFATGEGLVRYNTATGSIQRYESDEKDSGSIGSNRIISYLEDRSGAFWVGALDAGVNLMNRQTGRFRHYLQGFNGICMFEDTEGTIWAGTNRGLYRYNKKDDYFSPYFDSQSEISHEYIFGIMEDDIHNLWITTPSAIVKINIAKNETFIYDSKYGINPVSIHPNAYYKTRKGQLLIGHENGFYAFFPKELSEKTAYNILITDIFINSDPVKPGKGSPIQIPVEEINDLILRFNQNNIAFNFAAIDFREPEVTKYYTMMENYDNTWREALGEKNSYYFNISPGSYIYRVRAISRDGTKTEKAITIHINPPWWKTWWAYTMYGLFMLVTIFSAYRFQKKRIIWMEKQKAQLVELAQAKEIEKAYHELRSTQIQLVHSEKMASLGELTAGIAHEIQNPLNFVNNFSEVNKELIQEMKGEIAKGNIQEAMVLAEDINQNEDKIIIHGQRADAIVKSMLQHSRSSTGQKELVDINALADEYLRLSYHGLRAKDKSFNAIFQTDFDPAIGKINIIPQDIGRVLLNLYNNAFYAVNEKKKTAGEGYEPKITVTTKLSSAGNNFIESALEQSAIRNSQSVIRNSQSILITIADNGMGIPEKLKEKIFQPFFTTKPTGQGTGLGLSLSYDIIKAHGGDIKLKTNQNQGTEFIISLPI